MIFLIILIDRQRNSNIARVIMEDGTSSSISKIGQIYVKGIQVYSTICLCSVSLISERSHQSQMYMIDICLIAISIVNLVTVTSTRVRCIIYSHSELNTNTQPQPSLRVFLAPCVRSQTLLTQIIDLSLVLYGQHVGYKAHFTAYFATDFYCA